MASYTPPRMNPRRREILVVFSVISFASNLFLVGINWGLPSRRVDPFLFGTHPVWSGQQIAQLAGNRNENAQVGADVAQNANAAKLRPYVVNATDQQRAEIVRRYRLYSEQPDEMITLMSLATIRQHHGDPRLYQYGGLWIYPVGAMLQTASILHLIDMRSDQTFYLDHPGAFARFYVVMRLYTVAWGLAGAWAVFWLARRMSRDIWIAAAAVVGYALLPVVINAAHEAKPHLPGVALELFALMAALKFVETGKTKWSLTAGALCGAAAGMVLSGALTFILLPFMALERSRAAAIEISNRASPQPLAASRINRFSRSILFHFFLPLLAGILTYCITNPFVLLHLLGDPTILLSNLRNSQDMYRAPLTTDGIRNALHLFAVGTSPIIAWIGVLCAIVALRRHEPARSLLTMLALFFAAQFILLATDKPAEYARFGLLPDIALMMSAIVGIGSLFKKWLIQRWIVLIALLICIGLWGAGYVWNFGRDSVARNTRLIDADRIRQIQTAGARELAVYADPAPYCLPPVNLFDWRIMLLDREAAPPDSTDILVNPSDVVADHDMPMIGYAIQYWNHPRLLNTPICWAAKPFRVLVKKEFVPGTAR